MTAWLLTWLWQGTALAAGVALALKCAPRVNAATRHLIWNGVLAALTWLGWTSSPFLGLPSVPDPGPDAIYVPSAPDILMTVLFAIWAAATLISLLRLLPGLRAVHALRNRCRPFPPSVEARLPLWLEAKTHGRRTRLMLCDTAAGATVLGFNNPCIAIPSSLVAALKIEELDQVILHEYAHVQRRDDWSRLAQMLLLSVLWIHPAAVFASRAANREREMACDEWVVARTGHPKAYAACLARAAELRWQVHSGSPLLPAFIGRRHELVRRVDRLLAMRANARRTISFGAAGVAACAMALVSVQMQGVRFAEISEVVIPVDLMESVQSAQWVQSEQWVRWVQPAPEIRAVGPLREARQSRRASIAPTAPASAPSAPTAPIAPTTAPIAPAVASRAFPGAYSAPALPRFGPSAHIAAADKPITRNHWVEIGTSAKKTGIGLADAFSRAGASLARTARLKP